MSIPLQITFHGMKASPGIEAAIREKVEHLETLEARVSSCKVAVDAPHKSQTKGNRYHFRIEISIPGDHLVVSKMPEDPAHEDPYLALRDAFTVAHRMLRKDLERRIDREQQGAVSA